MAQDNRAGNMRRRALLWTAVALAAALLVVGIVYALDMRRAYGRIRGKSTVIPSPYGDIEYTHGGTGPPVLVIHGSGGGFDQGELLARAVLGEEFHWIAPSRFGYLRSTFHEGATFDDQAHAYAHLLDHLEVGKAAVIAMSHGGPSAVLFALLHPDRISSLTLMSAGVTSLQARVEAQEQANRKGDMLTAIFSYDPLYWTVSKLFRKPLMGLMGASAEVVAGLTQQQRALVDQVIDEMNPVSPRSQGVMFDNRAAMPNERISAIRAPTLILHAADDGLQLYQHAVFAAENIPGARLVRFERGGHLLVCVEQSAVRGEVQMHVLDHF
jgi:pimeloyl-ACP methyl ester carboxylesterase